MNPSDYFKEGSTSYVQTKQALDVINAARAAGLPEAEQYQKDLESSISLAKKSGWKDFSGFDATRKMVFGLAPKVEAVSKAKFAQPQEYGSEELAAKIQDAIGLADERNIDLSNSDISRLSSLVAKGDTKKASEQLSKISSYIDKSLAIQTEEEKRPQTLNDGTQIEIGVKSGTRYMGGQPVSKGAINSNLFNSMYQKESERKQQEVKELGVPIVSDLPAGQMYQTAPSEGVEAQPNVYAQSVQTSPTNMEEKQVAMRKAAEAYRSNNDEEAVVLMNSAGGKGLMGVFTREDLPAVFGAREPAQQAPAPSAQPTQQAQPTPQPQAFSSSQQDIFNAVKKANPNVPDEEIIKGLQSKPYFK